MTGETKPATTAAEAGPRHTGAGWLRARLTLRSADGPGLRPAVAVTVPGQAAVVVPLSAWPWVRAVCRALGSRVHEPPVLRPDYDPAADMARDLARAAQGWGG